MREYSPEVKAAVMAALMEGQSIREIAREHGVSKSTVAAWGKEAEGLVEGVQTVPDTKKEKIAGLLVDLLVAKIESQIVLSKRIQDATWFMKQDASAVAMLMGVNDDKLDRWLGRFAGAGSEPGSPTN